MSKDFFTPGEFRERQEKVRRKMAEERLDLLLVISPINIMYLIGSAVKAYQVFQCLFFTREERPLTLLLRRSDVNEAMEHGLAENVRGWGGTHYEHPVEAFAKVFKEMGLSGARIGLEMPAYYLSVHNYLALKDVLGGNEVVDATRLVEDIKMVKSPAELAYVRKAAEIADVGLDAIAKGIAEGRTEREVAAEAHGAMMAAGGDSPPSPMNFVSGDRTHYSHGTPSDRVLRRGDFMHVEFGGAYRRYVSTIARHYCVGEPNARQRQIHEVTLAACDAAIAAIAPGVPAVRPHEAAVGVIREAGLGDYCIHTTGYGIAPGFPPAWGESINMFYGSTDTLQAGMVVSIEPPVFIREERLGARLIDCVVVQEGGAQILSKYPRDLVVC